MMTERRTLMSKRAIRFLIVTFAITWTLWWAEAILVGTTSMVESDVLPMAMFILGGFGPTIAACLCLENGFSFKGLWKLVGSYKKGGAFFFVMFLILELIIFSRGATDLIPSLAELDLPIGMILMIFVQAVLVFGGNEELGWRGTLLPEFMKENKSLVGSSLIVGIIWVFWHLPLWFIPGNSHQNMSFLYFAIMGLLLSVWLSSLYCLSGSILMCMVIHGWTNTLMGIWEYQYTSSYLVGLMILTILAADSAIVSEKKAKEAAKKPADSSSSEL